MTSVITPNTSTNFLFPFFTSSDHYRFISDQWVDDRKFSLQEFRHENALFAHIKRRQPQVVIIGVDQTRHSTNVIAQLSTAENRPTIVALVKSNDRSLMTEYYDRGVDRVVSIPDCSPRIFRALIGTLIRKEHYYPPYLINSKAQTINIGGTAIWLTKKRFDVAQYLFMNHGKLISKSRILHDVWGLDSRQCITQRISVHICHVRKLLALDGSHGWEIRARRSKGYGLFHKA